MLFSAILQSACEWFFNAIDGVGSFIAAGLPIGIWRTFWSTFVDDAR